ncbi:MAG TPA: type IX secretion system membrane protein PorP/SprF [Flavobacteriales bacterium]|nr:type IX secretion system membrane protein PorP/SprF [Flavobacteriales bacterium]
MKKLMLIACLLIGFIQANAQHMPMFTQFFFNDYITNVAVAGSRPWFDVRSGHRYQWAGITDSPRTFTLSAFGPNKKQNMGYGFYLFTDNVGPTRRTGIQFSYAYHFKLSKTVKLSFGLSGGLLQYSVDGSKIILRDTYDAVISNGLQSSLVPDFTFGFHLYHEDWFIGASFPQLVQNNLYFFDYQTQSLSKLEDHYYATAGYTFHLGDDFDIAPAILFKYVKPLPPQWDFLARFIYKKQVWVGASLRTQDAWSLMAGYTWKNNLTIGYSYDVTTTGLRGYNSGTHELMGGIRLVKKEQKPSEKLY